MPQLTPLTTRRRAHARLGDDRGAVATVVAVLLAGGVLLGFLALVVDVGRLYVEREELQTGADAAALAVAGECATTAPGCASLSAIEALANQYADDNSLDGVSNVVEVCGRLPGRLNPCQLRAGNLTDCLGAEPATDPFVEVRLSTEMPSGDLVLPPTFAQMLAGNSGFDGASVQACARATWKPSADISIVAATVSVCEVEDATAAGLADPTNPSPADEYRIDLIFGHGDCDLNPPSPWHEAGPAGWLDSDGSCEVTIPADGIVDGDLLEPHLNPPGTCETRMREAISNREIIYLPVHDRADTHGEDRDYHHVSLAPFVVTGFYLGPDELPGGDHDEVSWLSVPPAVPCGGPERCISGIFVGEPVPITGATVKLIG